MKVFNKTQKNIAIVIFLNLILIAGYWFLDNKISSNNAQISNLADGLNKNLAREKHLNLSKRISEDTKIERQKLDSHFVPSDDVVSFIKEIEANANLAGVVVEINSVGTGDFMIKDKESNVLEVLDLRLSLKGRWSSLFYFLELLEEMPQKLEVKSLGFGVGVDNDPDWEGDVAFEVLKIK